jgi:WD40 repeat protein
VALGSDGQAVSWSDDGTLRVWELSSGRCTAVLEGHTCWVNGVALGSDGQAVSWSDDGTLRVWELSSGRCTATYPEQSEEARKTKAIAQSGPWAALIDPYGLTLESTADGTVLARFPGTFTVASCSADGRYVVAGDGRGDVYILRLHTRPGFAR